MVENTIKNTIRIAFIGGGNMAYAIAKGLYANHANHATGNSVYEFHVIDPVEAIREQWVSQLAAHSADICDVQLSHCDVVVLAVKPQQMVPVLREASVFVQKALIISVAAGVRATSIAKGLNPQQPYERIVRVMPNTPAIIGQGITGCYALPHVSEAEKKLSNDLMQCVGQTIWVEREELLDSVTAISGSGPAYVFYWIESLQQAAQSLGFDEATAKQLALQTFLGASQLARNSSDSLAHLREKVTSKGGTTYAALQVMEKAHLAQTIQAATLAAQQRAFELGEELDQHISHPI